MKAGMNDFRFIRFIVHVAVFSTGFTFNAGFTLNDAGFTLSDAGFTLNDASFTLSDAGFTLNDAGFIFLNSGFIYCIVNGVDIAVGADNMWYIHNICLLSALNHLSLLKCLIKSFLDVKHRIIGNLKGDPSQIGKIPLSFLIMLKRAQLFSTPPRVFHRLSTGFPQVFHGFSSMIVENN